MANSPFTKHTEKNISPEKKPTKKTLVLDLDETLVHGTLEPKNSNFSLVFEVCDFQRSH